MNKGPEQKFFQRRQRCSSDTWKIKSSTLPLGKYKPNPQCDSNITYQTNCQRLGDWGGMSVAILVGMYIGTDSMGNYMEIPLKSKLKWKACGCGSVAEHLLYENETVSLIFSISQIANCDSSSMAIPMPGAPTRVLLLMHNSQCCSVYGHCKPVCKCYNQCTWLSDMATITIAYEGSKWKIIIRWFYSCGI